jgi:hypothetical protein
MHRRSPGGLTGVWLGYGQAPLDELGSELAGGPHAVVENRGIDLQAADLVRVARPTVPVVLDAQHRDPLLGGDPLAQFFVPARHVCVQVVQLQRPAICQHPDHRSHRREGLRLVPAEAERLAGRIGVDPPVHPGPVLGALA